MKRYIIVDLFFGCPQQTDDKETAEGFTKSEDAFVIDTVTGKWLTYNYDEDCVEEVDIKDTSDN